MTDLLDRIEYLENQNKFLKTKLEELTKKYKELEHEYDKVWEENNNFRLVYGGGNIGLMGILAESCHQHGGEILGVMPHKLSEKEQGKQNIFNYININFNELLILSR